MNRLNRSKSNLSRISIEGAPGQNMTSSDVSALNTFLPNTDSVLATKPPTPVGNDIGNEVHFLTEKNVYPQSNNSSPDTTD